MLGRSSPRPTTPRAFTEMGTALTAAGMNYAPKVDLLTALADYRFVRFGWVVWYAAGTVAVFGRSATGQLEVWLQE